MASVDAGFIWVVELVESAKFWDKSGIIEATKVNPVCKMNWFIFSCSDIYDIICITFLDTSFSTLLLYPKVNK